MIMSSIDLLCSLDLGGGGADSEAPSPFSEDCIGSAVAAAWLVVVPCMPAVPCELVAGCIVVVFGASDVLSVVVVEGFPPEKSEGVMPELVVAAEDAAG